MKAGDKVKCVGPLGYRFTTNKVYEVIDYQPEQYDDDNFTWPAYVLVEDDYGKQVWCHAHRFVPAHTQKPCIRLIRRYTRKPDLVGWWGVFIGDRYAWGSLALTPAAAWRSYRCANAGLAEPEEVQ